MYQITYGGAHLIENVMHCCLCIQSEFLRGCSGSSLSFLDQAPSSFHPLEHVIQHFVLPHALKHFSEHAVVRSHRTWSDPLVPRQRKKYKIREETT